MWFAVGFVAGLVACPFVLIAAACLCDSWWDMPE